MQQIFYGVGIVLLMIVAHHFMKKVKDKPQDSDLQNRDKMTEENDESEYTGNSENN